MKTGDRFRSRGDRSILFLAAYVLLLVSCACNVQAEKSFYPITTSDKAFFGQIRKAILTENMDWLASAVSYPIILRPGSREITVRSKRDFKKRAKLFLNENLKSTVRNQSPEKLFKNWQGVMIGRGEIWFSEVIEEGQKERGWVYGIIAIN